MQSLTARRLGGFASLECSLVSDGTLELPVTQLFPAIPAPEVERAKAGGSTNPLPSPLNCLLVRGDGLIVLVDAGYGRADDRAQPGGRLLHVLRAVGTTPPDVDVVVVTHAHPDHIGGLCAHGRPVFTRARHVLTRTEWDFWTSDTASSGLSERMRMFARSNLPPLERAGLVDLVDGETTLAPDLRILPAPGHTPGHSVVEIGPPHESLLYLADAVVHTVQYEHPEWPAATDMAAHRAVETRRSLLERAAARGSVVAAFHVGPVGRLRREHGGYALLQDWSAT